MTTLPHEIRVASRTRPGIDYRVLVGLDGRASCTCAGYEIYHHCVHATETEGRMTTTENSQALVPIRVEPPTTALPTQSDLAIIGTLARTVVAARGHAVPKEIDSPAKAAAVMLAGWELGVKPMSALRHIIVVNGRTEPDAQLMLGIVLARESDASFDVIELSDELCTMRIRRPGREINALYTYRIEDAKRAGLVKQGNPWSLYPRDMLRWACVKRLCRAYAPDLINSVGAEVGAGAVIAEVAQDAEPIDLEAVDPAQLYSPGDDREADAGEPAPQVAEGEESALRAPSATTTEAGEQIALGAAR